LAEAGGVRACAPADAADGADVLVLMVVNAAQAEAVLFEGGALAALPKNSIVVLMATCPPRAVELIAARVVEAGRSFVDAPVSGGVVGARAATLSIITAAPRVTFAAVRPVLEAVGDKVFHVGERPGQGAMIKTVNQLLCGVHIAAAAEALAFAEALGLAAADCWQVLREGAAASFMFDDRGARMVAGEFREARSALDIFVKDMGLVGAAADRAGAPVPLAEAARRLYERGHDQGMGRLDDSALIEVLRQGR